VGSEMCIRDRELLELEREADVFVHPAWSEGLPNAVLEAMAQSLPVVASKVSGLPGLITDGVTGLLVAPGRPDEIAEAVWRLAENPDLVDRLRRAAFSRAQEYGSDVLAERSKRLIESTFAKIADAADCTA